MASEKKTLEIDNSFRRNKSMTKAAAKPADAPVPRGRRTAAKGNDGPTGRKQAGGALHDVSELNRQMIAAASDGILVYDCELKCLIWNPVIEKLTERSASQALGKPLFEVFPFLQHTEIKKRIEKTLAGQPCPELEILLHPPHLDRPIWISETLSAIRNAKGKIIGGMSIVRDITERKQVEERIAQLNRALAILAGIDRAIVRIPDRQKLLDEVCRVAVEVGGFKLAWVGMVAPDGSVQPVAQAGAAGYLEGIRVVTRDEPEGRGPAGMAIRENRPVVIEEADRDPSMIPWHGRLRQFGLRYVAAFPIQIAGKVAGSFQVYAPKAHFFDEHELGLLTQMNDDVSYALTAISDFTARKQAEEALHDASELNQQMVAATKDGIAVFDRETKYLIFNPALEKITSKPASEVLGKRIFEAFPFLKETELAKRVEQTLAGETCAEQEILLHPPHTGRPIWISDNCSTLRNGKGEIIGGMSVVRDITERKQAQEAIRRSETKFRTLFNFTCDAVMMLDEKGFCDCNAATLAMFGCARAEEFLSKHPGDLSPPAQPDGSDSRTLASRHIAIARKKGSHQFEWLHKRSDTGEVFPADVLLSAMELDGKMVLQATVRDITERKQAEERIARLSRVQTIMASIDRAIVHIGDRQKLLDEVCRVAVEEGGFKLAWVGMVAPNGSVRPVAKAGATEYLDSGRVMVQDVPEGRGPTGTAIRENRPVVIEEADQDPRLAPWHEHLRKFEMRYIAAFPIRIAGKVVGAFQVYAPQANFFNENEVRLLTQVSNDVSYALTAISDLAARKLAEEAMRRSEHNLTIFFNQAPVGLVWLSADGAILRANQAQLDLLGCPAPDYLGHSFTEACVEPAQGSELLERLAAGRTVRHFRLALRCKDGTVRHVLVDAVSFLAEAASFWKDSHFRYSSIFLRDVTDLVKLEREILQAGERESRRIAQDLHDGLGQLLAGTAHIASTLQKDLAAKSRPEARRMDRILELIHEAIAQARSLSQGLHPVEPEGNGLMAALEFLATRTKSLFQAECRFTCRQPVLIPDNAVATHLFRIAQEAVSNAIKHGKPGHIEIRLSGAPERIQLVIRDNGAGMPARQRKNSGMGLRIMRYRAGMINGSLAIENESGGGTAVVCTVPLPGAGALKRRAQGVASGLRPDSSAPGAGVLKRRAQAAGKED